MDLEFMNADNLDEYHKGITSQLVHYATKQEFQSMTEEEKQGLVVVIDEDNPNVGSFKGEVYSTEEIRIGTWIDGKPLYRKVFVAGEDAVVNMNANAFEAYVDYADISDLDIESIIFVGGMATLLVSYPRPNFYASGLSITYAYVRNDYKSIRIKCRRSNLMPSDTEVILIQSGGNVIIEYTKTTD